MKIKQGNTFLTILAGYGVGEEDKTIYPGVCPDGVDGVNYPASTGPLFTEEGKAELGVVEVVSDPRPDDQFYYVTDNGDGTFSKEPKDRDSINEMIWERIKAIRDDRAENGGYKINTKWYHSDQKSRNQQLGLVALAAIPNGLKWKTMDGTFINMTKTLAGQILEGAAASDFALFTAAETHKANVAALVTVEEVMAYDYLAGWPAIYVKS